MQILKLRCRIRLLYTYGEPANLLFPVLSLCSANVPFLILTLGETYIF
jgi:hypothetical protein